MSTAAHARPLRIAIDSRLHPGLSGGVEQFVIGLASALSSLEDTGDRYCFLTYVGENQWLRPYLKGSCEILEARPPTRLRGIQRRVATAAPGLRAGWRRVQDARIRDARDLPTSDGTIERAGIDVIHFTTQNAFLTSVSSIYHPWDLQHLHFPDFFTPATRRRRDISYRAFCEQAALVVAATNSTKRDVVASFGISAGKVAVIAIPPVLGAYPTPTASDLETTRRKFSLPSRYVFYPAQTWPHKNHVRLVGALAILRERMGVRVPVVCSGHLNEHSSNIRREVERLRISEQVSFVGFVTPVELQCLYRSCRGLVFPSLFEGWGFPIVEAFLAGVPVACSTAASLPQLVGDAAVQFDPFDEEDIADAILRIWTDDALCASLVERGHRAVESLDWAETARTFRAHYRQVAKQPLAEEDRGLVLASIGSDSGS